MPDVILVGKDGGQYSFPEEKAQEALASGQFSAAPSEDAGSKFIDRSAMNVPIAKDAGLNQETEVPEVSKEKPGKETNFLNLIDAKSGEEVPVLEENANALVASGSHTVSDVPLMGADGKLYQIPDDKIPEAVQSGQFRLSTLKERQQNQAKEAEDQEIERGGATGLKPYIGGALDAALAGINEHNPVSGIGTAVFGDKAVNQEQEKIAEKVKEEHPVGYWTGAGIGEIGSAIGLGGAAGGLAKSFGLKGAAKLAAEGAVYSAEPVTQAVVNKDPAGAAEALALGVGLNFGIHGIFSAVEKIPGVLNKGTSAVTEKIAPAAIEQEEAENLLGKEVLGLSPAKIAVLRDKIGPALKAAKITSEDVVSGKALEKIQALESSGPAIGKAIDELDSLFKSEKQPIIEEHLDRARQDIEKLMPPEVQAQNKIVSRLRMLLNVANPEDNDGIREALEKYIKQTDEYNAHINEAPPIKPDELIEWEKEQNPQERETVAPGAKNAPPPVEKPTFVKDYEKLLDEYEKATYEGAEAERAGQKVKEVMEHDKPMPSQEVSDWYREQDANERKTVPPKERPDSSEYDKAKKEYDERHARPKSPRALPREFDQYLEQAEKYEGASNEIDEIISKLDEIKLPPSALQAKRALQPLIDEMEATAKKGTFEETQKLKQFIREQTNFTDNGFANRLRKGAYQAVSEHLMDAEDKAAEIGGLTPGIKEGLQQQRAAYTFHKLFGDAADRLAAKEIPESTLQKIAGMHHYHRRSLPILMLHMLGIPSALALAAGLAMPFTKEYLAKQTLKRAAQKLLGESVTPETNTLLHSLQMRDVKISDTVKNTLSALTSAKGAEEAKNLHANSLKEFSPPGLKGEQARLDVLRRSINENLNDPIHFAQHIGSLTQGLKAEGMGQVADEYTQHQLRLMKVLQTILPVDPNLNKSHPFSAQVTVSEISPAVKAQYERALSIAADPIKLLSMIKNNTITKSDVAIAAAVNPSTLQKMREELVNQALKSKPDLSYQQRLSMDILMGTNLDESTEQLPVLQDAFLPVGPVSPPKRGTKMSPKQQENFSQSYLTQSEKAMMQ